MRLIALAVAIGAAGWFLGSGVGKPAVAGFAGGECAATAVHYQPTKKPGLSDLPWVRARPGRNFVMGLLVSYLPTLRDASVSRSDGLVVWTRGERIVWTMAGGWTAAARMIARRLGGRESFRVPLTSGRRGLVSTLRFPRAGCWRLTLRTGRGVASVVALVVPRPAKLACDATPVEATSMALVRPHGAGIAAGWSWFTSDHSALIFTRGAAPQDMYTKVLWWVRRNWGGRLRLTGIRLDGDGSFRQAFVQAGDPSGYAPGYHAAFPSTVYVPSAGCWLFRLRTGRVAGVLVVRAIDR